MSLDVRHARWLSVGFAFCMVGSAVVALEAAPGGIDADLDGQLDFRDVEFSICSDQTECRVEGVEIRAERRDELDTTWIPAKIYWDPIDGIGVTDGGQNDEIDFDERIVVQFDAPRSVSRLWLSDLFLGEDPRYGSRGDSPVEAVTEDVEVADVALFSGDVEMVQLRIFGEIELPEDPFNSAISTIFEEGGDLRRRVVLTDDRIRVIAPNPQQLDANVLLEAVTGAVDADKKVIFEGVETFEIDLAEILAEFDEARLFAAGTRNFDRVQALLGDRPGLAELGQAAASRRLVGDHDNGEIAAELSPLLAADRIEYTAPVDGSNDFSVAGVVFQEQTSE